MGTRIRALLLALAVLAPACGLVGGDDGADAPAPTLPAETAVLRVASVPWPSCLNPLTCTDEAAAWLVWDHVLPKLMEVGVDGEYEPSPVLAGDPQVDTDPGSGQLTVTFVLDEEARWHDGRPITSSDVAGTWLARRATPGALVGGWELITGVDDVDPLVARVTLSRAHADWPELFGGHAGWLLQADAFGGQLDLTGLFEDRELAFGAGPFELATFNDRAIVLSARDEHWAPGRQPAVDQVRIERLPSDAADVGEAVSGGIDAVVPGPGPVGRVGRFDRVDRPEADVVGVLLDRRSPALGSVAVREAIARSIDRSRLAGMLDGMPGLVTCVGLLPQQPACRDRLPATSPAPTLAESLLEADGWALDPGGGRGRPEEPLLVPVSHDPAVPGADDVAQALADALSPLGFGIVPQVIDTVTWRDDSRTGSTGVGVFSVPLATAEELTALHRCGDGTVNPLGWCEPGNQALAATLLGAADLGDRADAAAQLAELSASTWAWLPLRQRSTVVLVDPDRVEAPSEVPVGAGPLGSLHAFARVDR